MSSQERRAKGKPCPRGCGGTVLDNERTKYNAISPVDGLQICVNCYTTETIQTFMKGV